MNKKKTIDNFHDSSQKLSGPERDKRMRNESMKWPARGRNCRSIGRLLDLKEWTLQRAEPQMEGEAALKSTGLSGGRRRTEINCRRIFFVKPWMVKPKEENKIDIFVQSDTGLGQWWFIFLIKYWIWMDFFYLGWGHLTFWIIFLYKEIYKKKYLWQGGGREGVGQSPSALYGWHSSPVAW